MRKRLVLVPFPAVAIVLLVAASAWACGNLTGSLTLTGQNGASVVADGLVPTTHDDQTLTYTTMPQSCNGVVAATLTNGATTSPCPANTPGWVKIATGNNGAYLPASASSTTPACSPIGTVVNGCDPNAITRGNYAVKYLNGPVYTGVIPSFGVNPDPTTIPPGYRFPNCGLYGNGNGGFVSITLGSVTIGSSAIDTTGNITGVAGGTLSGSTAQFNLPTSVANAPGTESAVCVVDRLSEYANIAPVQIV